MDKRQLIRIIVFGFINFLPNLMAFWPMVILPEILEYNLNIRDKSKLSQAASIFLAMGHFGMILGSFFQPHIVNLMSMRSAILLGMIIQTILNAWMGQTSNIYIIYIFRFVIGFFLNMNSVGKAFIFEFAVSNYRQYAFSLKTEFTLIAVFLAPFIGFYVYTFSDKSFALSLLYLSGTFLIGIAAFYIVFFLDYEPSRERHASDVGDEETKALVKAHQAQAQEASDQPKSKDRQIGVSEVARICIRSKELLPMLIIYLIMSGSQQPSIMIAIFFLESSWASNGFGISSQLISLTSIIALVPVSIILMVSPTFTPKIIGYGTFLRFFMILLMASLIALPALRDVFPEQGHERLNWIPITVLVLLYVSVPKIYSPFINFYLNSNIERKARTGLNSLTFLLSNLSSGLMLVTIGPLLSLSLFSPSFEGYYAISKYLSFVVLDLLIVACYIISFRYK